MTTDIFTRNGVSREQVERISWESVSPKNNHGVRNNIDAKKILGLEINPKQGKRVFIRIIRIRGR